MYTLYTDGSAQPNPGPSGCGAVMLNDKGGIVWTLSEFLGLGSNNSAELTAIRRGCERAVELKVDELVVYSDSELAVNLLTGKKQTKKEHLLPIVLRIHEVISGYGMLVKFEWIKAHNNQKYNEMADKLADMAVLSADPLRDINDDKQNLNLSRERTITPMPVINPTNRLFLKCPFSEKDEVKKRGARWDPEAKSWYAENTHENREKFAEWIC